MKGDVGAVAQLLQSGVGKVFPAASLSFGRSRDPETLVVGDATADTWFDIASLTKALATTLLVMKLCDTNRLSLDEDILPGASVAQLLSHSAGFPACFPSLWADSQGLLVAPSAQTRRVVIDAVWSTSRQPAPQRSLYSDLGFIALGTIVEERGEGRLDELLAQFLGPLGLALGFRPLDRTSPLPASQCAPTRRESPHREELRGIVHDDTARAMLGVAGHAGLFATSAAVYRLAQALLDCYHDTGSATARALSLRSATVRRFFALPGLPGLQSTWGLGFDHPDPYRPGSSSTSSAGSLWSRQGVGHLGFTGCSLWLDPQTRLTAVLLSNRVWADTNPAAEATKAALRMLRPALHDAIAAAVVG